MNALGLITATVEPGTSALVNHKAPAEFLWSKTYEVHTKSDYWSGSKVLCRTSKAGHDAVFEFADPQFGEFGVLQLSSTGGLTISNHPNRHPLKFTKDLLDKDFVKLLWLAYCKDRIGALEYSISRSSGLGRNTDRYEEELEAMKKEIS